VKYLAALLHWLIIICLHFCHISHAHSSSFSSLLSLFILSVFTVFLWETDRSIICLSQLVYRDAIFFSFFILFLLSASGSVTLASVCHRLSGFIHFIYVCLPSFILVHFIFIFFHCLFTLLRAFLHLHDIFSFHFYWYCLPLPRPVHCLSFHTLLLHICPILLAIGYHFLSSYHRLHCLEATASSGFPPYLIFRSFH